MTNITIADFQMISKINQQLSEIPVVSGQQRLGAVAVSAKGKIIATGFNDYKKTHPLQKYFSVKAGLPEKRYCTHAELQALLRCGTKQPKTLYVSRLLKDGSQGMARPCPACIEALRAFGVNTIVYAVGADYQLPSCGLAKLKSDSPTITNCIAKELIEHID